MVKKSETVTEEKHEEKPADKPARPRKPPMEAKPTSDVAARAAAIILKVTGQKPLEPSYSTLPHVPSGSTLINLLIGGSPATDGHGCVCPGYPRKRITEIYGPESSGKTTTALAAIADCQKRGGVAMFIDFAELRALNRQVMTMTDWLAQVERFLNFTDQQVLRNAGRISHEMALAKAHEEYEKFRLNQDRDYLSDFDQAFARYLKGGAQE